MYDDEREPLADQDVWAYIPEIFRKEDSPWEPTKGNITDALYQIAVELRNIAAELANLVDKGE